MRELRCEAGAGFEKKPWLVAQKLALPSLVQGTSTSHHSKRLQDMLSRRAGAMPIPKDSRRDSELKKLTALV